MAITQKQDEEFQKKAVTQMVELLWLGLKITKPTITKHDAENIIINTGNYLQLHRIAEEATPTNPS